MCTGRSLVVVAALTLVGCAASDEDDGDIMLRVRVTGAEIASVDVIDRAAPEEFEDGLRPQEFGETGIIWTDFESGETLAGGWMPPMQEVLYVVVPAPGPDGALLTMTVPTEQGPFVLTAHVEP
jgi:hypothetical protein